LIIGGTGYLYGGIIGAVIFRLAQDYLANLTPQYWGFWIGAFLVVIVIVGRERMARWASPVKMLVDRFSLVVKAGKRAIVSGPGR
jgi:branched-chain amino acid transport system permease protein